MRQQLRRAAHEHFLLPGHSVPHGGLFPAGDRTWNLSDFRVPTGNSVEERRYDRSEMDLKLGKLLIEAKLTEGDFQSARFDLVHRYRDLELVFDVARLPMKNQKYRSCQLIRGALAAHAHELCLPLFATSAVKT